MNEIVPFSYAGREVRTVTIGDEPCLVAADVCDVLDIKNPSDALKKLDADEKGLATIYTPGGPQEMAVLNEAGFYRIVMRSTKPQARPFQRWVTHEVLPAIRKAGAYNAPEARAAIDAAALGEIVASAVVAGVTAAIREVFAEQRRPVDPSPGNILTLTISGNGNIGFAGLKGAHRKGDVILARLPDEQPRRWRVRTNTFRPPTWDADTVWHSVEEVGA